MSKKNIFLTVLILFWCAFTLCPLNISNAASGNLPRIGVWITVFSEEKVLYSKESIDRLIGICGETGINDIYVQIYRANKAYYDSDITDRTAYETILSEAGEDTLAYLIGKAKNNNLNIYAWINLLSIAANEDAGVLKKFGKDILTRDQYGRTARQGDKKDELDKYYIRENQLFLEPGDSRVREYLTDIAEEIAGKYPGLTGLHFDYVRYPAAVPFIPGSRFTSHGISYGYTEANIKNFKNATGLDVETMEYSRENSRLWDGWRRKQVNALLRDISEHIRALAPSMKISCTVVPSIERTYLSTFQDWTGWLRKGYVDYVVAMNYTDDTALMELNSSSLLLPGLDKKVHIGIGAYLLKDKPETLKDQLKSLRELSPSGIVIFSYDEIARDEEIRKYLSDNFRTAPPLS